MASAAKKLKGAATYKCFFKEKWSKQYFISTNDGDNHAFYCTPRRKYVSCSYQGLADVTKHYRGVSHISFENQLKTI